RPRHRLADHQAVHDREVSARGHRVAIGAPVLGAWGEVAEVHLPPLQAQLVHRALEEVRGQAVPEAAGAGVEHDPEPGAAVLQLDEVIAATQAAELVLPAPGARVPGDVPALVHGDAIALRRAPAAAHR